MKQKYTFLFLTVLSAVFSCAQIDEGNLEEKVEVEKVAMTFTASIEKDVDTKTELGGNVGDALRKVYWQPSDKIGVTVGDASDYTAPVEVFTSTSASRAEKAEFEGAISFSSSYHAFYPYSADLSASYGEFVFNLPQVQKYVRGTFDPNAAPMAAKASAGEELQFRNLCGILAIQLKGTGSVKSITFMGRDEMGQPIDVAGKFEVDMTADDYPNLKVSSDLKSSVTLECGEAVALSSASDTPFYLVLPPATYSSFIVLITMADGNVMVKEGTKPLTIKRSDIANASSLTYVESVAIDLSERGNSNCYIVPKAGIYSFDASVIGNREFGLMEGFHTDNVKISPSSVFLLWEDRNGVVLSPSMDGNKVRFIATGQEGNALLAVNDASGQTLWSWHIWVTDQPQEQVYVNERGTFTMLDRNIGATRADKGTGEEYRQSEGLRYQWGRKDPFEQNTYNPLGAQLTIAESIQLPTTFAYGNYPWAKNWNRNFWCPSQKTIYDPCPVGYRVPTMDVWYGFSNTGENVDRLTDMNISGGFDCGLNFYYDGTNTAWYPVNGCAHSWWETWNDRGRIWSAENDGGGHSYCMNYYYASSLQTELNITGYNSPTYDGQAVRCMKDQGYVDTSLPTVHVKNFTDRTSSSARVVCEITYPGSAEVTERGFVWSTNADFSTSTRVPCGSGAGEYAMTINGLSEVTRYFVKPYAVNSYGTSYGEVKHFVTAYSGSGTDLSAAGTANSYMILPQKGIFYFDATVKGNSEESVGTPASAEILWAVDENHNSSENIIQNVELRSNLIFFQTTDSVIPGNALVAVKDENGIILWSWHIWVVDYDPEWQNQTYYSGAVMMDRNLGATFAMPELADYSNTWKPAAGMIYQWGRKDPLMYENVIIYGSCFDSVQESVTRPTEFAAGGNYWVSPMNEYLWQPGSKTMYDPCPAGWRVAPKSAWENILHDTSYYPYGSYIKVNEGQYIWCGHGPYMHSSGSYFENSGAGYTWTSDYYHGSIHGYTIHYGDGWWEFSNSMNATDAYPVRCMKEN